MAVTEETPVNVSTANGSTTVFPYGFMLLKSSDLQVTGDLNGAAITYTEGVDYTVDGVGAGAGSVIFAVAPANGTIITRARATKLERLTDYQDAGDFLAGTVNPDFDRIWYALQEFAAGAFAPKTTLRVPEAGGVPALPSATVRALKQLTFDASGNPLCVAPASGSATDLATLLSSTGTGKGAALWKWKASGTGAVDMTGDQLLKSMAFTPEMFGGVADANPATGTGTDATAAINKAIKAAWDSLQTAASADFGGIVYISAGNWLISTDQIVQFPGVTVIGAGMFATNLIVPAGSTGIAWKLDASTPPYSNVPGYPSTLCHLAFRAAAGGAPNATGVYANKNGCFIDHIWVSGFTQNNIIINNTDVVLTHWVSEYSNYALTILQPAVTVSIGIVGTGCVNGVFVQNQLIMQAVSGGASTIQFPAVTTTPVGQAVSTTNGAFVGWLVTIKSGTGAGQQRVISAYTGATRTATVSPAWSTPPDSTSVFDVDYDNGVVSLSDIRIQPCSQLGLDINKARRVRGQNITMAQTSAAKFLNGAARVIDSVDVDLQGVGGSSALWSGAVNTVADGLTITNSALVDVRGGNWLYWRKGVVQNGGQNITLRLGQVNSNYNGGVQLNGGDQIQLLEGQISANGSAGGASDFGVQSNNTSAGGVHIIGGGVLCSGLGGSQEYGIQAFVQDNGGSTGLTFIEGKARNNTTANISLTGRVDRIRTFGALNGDSVMGAIIPTTQIVNAYSAGGVSSAILPSALGAASVTVNTPSAGTLVQALNLTGQGELPSLAAVAANATPRTIRLQVIVDGVTVFDATSNSISATNTGLLAAGAASLSGSSSQGAFYSPIRYTQSCVVNVASSLSESGGINLLYASYKN